MLFVYFWLLAALAISPASAQNATTGTIGRAPLAATQNLYVATTGSDTNNGCTNSGSPCLTIQKAVNQYLANYDGKSNVTNINVANGTTYQGFSCSGAPVGTALGATTTAYLSIVGTNGSGNVTIADTGSAAAAVIAGSGCVVGLQGLKIQSTTGNDVFAQSGGLVYINTDIVLGPAGLGKIHADFGTGIVNVQSSYTSIGNAAAEFQGTLGGHIIFNETAITVTLSSTPVYSVAFADLQDGAVLYTNSNFVTFSGSATGKRFQLKANAVAETIGGTATYYPGSIAGTVASGGYYSPGTYNIGTAPIPASNVTLKASANPTGTTNLTGNGVMMGLAGTITPQTSGNILFTYSGACANTTVADGGGVTIYVGTGTAPTNGAALTGSPISSQVVFTESTAAAFLPCSGSAIATAQTVGTALWYDLALVARTGGTASLAQVSMTATEL